MLVKPAPSGFRRWIGWFAVLVVTACLASGAAVAQSEGLQESHSPSFGPSMMGGGGDDRTSAANQATAMIIRIIREDSDRCERFPWVYRYDCLHWVLRDASEVRTRQPSDYRNAQEILGSGAAKLKALVDQYEDPAQPPSRIGTRTIRAVKQSARPEVQAAGAAIINETESLLLRSGGTTRRQVQYDKIAAAVSATELLLRSALEQFPGFPRHAIRSARRFAAILEAGGLVRG